MPMRGDGDRQLDEMIAALQKLPDEMVRGSLQEISTAVLAVSRDLAGQGLDPDGKPWPLKTDGGQPLVHAADHLKCAPLGSDSIVLLTGSGIDAAHSQGRVTGGKKRVIVPDSSRVPAAIGKAVERVLDAKFAKVTGGTP